MYFIEVIFNIHILSESDKFIYAKQQNYLGVTTEREQTIVSVTEPSITGFVSI